MVMKTVKQHTVRQQGFTVYCVYRPIVRSFVGEAWCPEPAVTDLSRICELTLLLGGTITVTLSFYKQ